MSRLGKVRKRSLLSAYAKLHAANGETARTVVVVLGVHAGTVEVQGRPVHARHRVRRTAPGVTALAHNVQVAGIAGAVTRSGTSSFSPEKVGSEERLLCKKPANLPQWEICRDCFCRPGLIRLRALRLRGLLLLRREPPLRSLRQRFLQPPWRRLQQQLSFLRWLLRAPRLSWLRLRGGLSRPT